MIFRMLAGASLAVLAQAAQAGDVPLYAPAPDWAVPADVKAAAAKASGPLVLYDVQEQIEGSSVTTYLDMAFKIDSPQALTQANTLSAVWMPDKGDITFHRAELVRDGKSIDLLSGDKFTVLRREQQLEQRTITGMLTATLPVSGAHVGDVLRMTYSVKVADQALGDHVQRLDFLPAGDFKPGLARIRMRWPKGRAIRMSAGPRVSLPPPQVVGGFEQFELTLPLEKPKDLPSDAPGRFTRPAILQTTSFTDWKDVSRTMAPLFATEGKLAKDGPIMAEVDKIAAASADPIVRAAKALRLVQDRISYLENGMNGGNYIPQSPDKTWTSRYGDCKAKTLLLLSMLRAMGIEAEPLLVNATMSDSVGEALPMPGDFDHVIVLARIGGKDLYLDGTTLGTRQSSLIDVPPFSYGLPLRSAGAELMAIPHRAPGLPSISVRNYVDLSAGIDFPALYDVTIELTGASAALLQQASNLPKDSKDREKMIDYLVGRIVGTSDIVDRQLSFDADSGVATITAYGLAESYWDRSAKRAVYKPGLPGDALTFEANRGRATWKDIPVKLNGPDRVKTDLTVDLPAGVTGYTMEGASLHASAAGGTIDREAKLDGTRLHVSEELATTGGELPVADIAAERSKFAALKAVVFDIKAPADAPRAWDPKSPADRVRLKRIEAAYAKLIADDPSDETVYIARAGYLGDLRDLKRALLDLDKAVDIDASADNYALRSQYSEADGDLKGALVDARRANEADPGPARIARMASLMGQSGQAAAALALVETALDHPGDAEIDLVSARAELLARLGRKDEGLAALDSLNGERPGDGKALNARCWFHGTWNFALDSAAKDCDAAVQAADYAPAVLDSRALAQFRLGKLDAALADANAALARASGQDETLLLRGVIRRKMGDKAGAADIAEALRRRPGLKRVYTEWGLLP